MGLTIIFMLICMHLPFPLATIVGEDVCKWTTLLAALYFTSQTVWSFCIAFYRVLFIKFQNLFKNGIKETTFVIFLSQAGFLYIASSGVFFTYYERGMLYKMCTHKSLLEIQVLDVSNYYDYFYHFKFRVIKITGFYTLGQTFVKTICFAF
jgi:hypothetical protein